MGYSSQSGQVLFRSQAVQGTYQADTGTAGVAMKLRGGSLGPNRDLLVPDPEIGGGRDITDAYLGAASWSGDYDFYGRVDGINTLLKACLGSASGATVTGVTTQTITPLDSGTLPFLSIEEKIGNGLETYNYNDCVVNTFHLESDANGYLMGTAGIISAKQIAGATPTASPIWDTTPMYVGTNIAVTYNSVALPAKSFSLDINNNFEDDDFRLGSFFIGDLTAKRREITASFGIRHGSSALWRQAVYGTPSATGVGGITTKAPLVITCTSYEDIPASTPLTKYSIVITIPNFTFTPFAFAPNGDDILENDVDGQGFRPSAGTAAITVVTKSGKATVA